MYGEGVRATLEGAGGIDVVALARTAAAGLEAVRALQPEVAVVDIGLPDASGLSVVAALQGTCRVLVLTSSDDDATVFAALRAGAIALRTPRAWRAVPRWRTSDRATPRPSRRRQHPLPLHGPRPCMGQGGAR